MILCYLVFEIISDSRHIADQKIRKDIKRKTWFSKKINRTWRLTEARTEQNNDHM